MDRYDVKRDSCELNLKGIVRMITKENVKELFPKYDRRLTQEEFNASKMLSNDDTDFKDMIDRYASLEDVSERLKPYIKNK